MGEGFLFEHAESEGNSIDDRDIEKVETCIDFVADELFGFFNKGVHFLVLVGDNHSESARVFHFSEGHSGFLLMFFVELKHFLEGKVTNDVTIEDKKET